MATFIKVGNEFINQDAITHILVDIYTPISQVYQPRITLLTGVDDREYVYHNDKAESLRRYFEANSIDVVANFPTPKAAQEAPSYPTIKTGEEYTFESDPIDTNNE